MWRLGTWLIGFAILHSKSIVRFAFWLALAFAVLYLLEAMATGLPKIFHDQRLADATPVASSTATGFDVLNLRDWRAYTRWKPAALPATVTVDSGVAKAFDYFFVLGAWQGNTLELRKSNDNFAANDVLVASITPADDEPKLAVFAQQSERYTRLKVANGTAPEIAIAAWGAALEFPRRLPRGFDPIGRQAEGESNRSIAGHPLGKVWDFEDWSRRIRLRNLTWTFVRTTWLPAWEAHLRSSPFAFAWDPVDHADEIYVVTTDGEFQTAHQSGDYTDLEFRLMGIIQ